MCFAENNKYFLLHSLTIDMKGLPNEEKLARYNLIRKEMRQRFQESYHKCENKIKFYHDAFEWLPLYEANYLLLNVFYENDSITIINYLHQLRLLDNIQFREVDSIPYKYWSNIMGVMKVKGAYKDDDEIAFIKINFLGLVQEISPYDWNLRNQNSNAIISKYSIWAFKTIKNESNLKIVIQSFILFVKIWNDFVDLPKTFNTKAILLYNYIISEYNRISEPKIFTNVYNFIFELGSIFSSLCVNIEYVPILDTKNSIIYKSGYLIRRAEFLEKFRQLEKGLSISKIDSIIDLFRTINGKDDMIFMDSAKTVLEKKNEKLEIPKYNDLVEISNMELSKNAIALRKYYFRNLYLFEL